MKRLSPLLSSETGTNELLSIIFFVLFLLFMIAGLVTFLSMMNTPEKSERYNQLSIATRILMIMMFVCLMVFGGLLTPTAH